MITNVKNCIQFIYNVYIMDFVGKKKKYTRNDTARTLYFANNKFLLLYLLEQ